MTSIYLIENKITGQCYVGKTMHSIEHRFYQHCHDSNNAGQYIKKIRCNDYPLLRGSRLEDELLAEMVNSK